MGSGGEMDHRYPIVGRPDWLFVPAAATGGNLSGKGARQIRAYIEHLEGQVKRLHELEMNVALERAP